MRFQEENLLIKNKTDLDKYIKHPGFFERGNYKRIILNLTEVFNKDQVLFLFYEDIFNPLKHENQIKQLCNKLNIKYKEANINEKILKSRAKQLKPEYRHHLIASFKDIYTFTLDHFGYIPSNWINDLNLLKQPR